MSMTDAGGAAAPANDAPLSLSEAVASYTSRMERENEEPAADNNSTEGAGHEPAAADTQSDPQGNDTTPPQQEATGETQEADPAEVPPLDLPRSWAKDKTELWSGLDRATQEYLLEHDSKSSAEVRRGQNEVAEQRKALEAKSSEVEKALTDYITNGDARSEMLQEEYARKFPDLKTMDDVYRLTSEAARLADIDPFMAGKINSYVNEWRSFQDRLIVHQNSLQQAKTRLANETQTKFAEFANKENASLAEKMPEFADKAKGPELSKKMVAYLRDSIGITDKELGSYASGEKISPLDHRLQIMAVKAMRYDEAQASKSQAIPKPVPKVQKPGAAQPKGAANAANLQALSQRLNQTSSLKDALALYNARRAAAS